jgi:hypothetical protein
VKTETKLVVRGASLAPRFSFGAAAFSLLALVPGACSNDADDCHQLKTCGGASGAGGSSSGGASGASGTSGASGEAGMGAGGEAGAAGAGTGGSSGTTGGSSGSSGNGGEGGGEPPCDATKSPSEDVCVIDETYGVFVSPDGDNDDGDGTRANPYATLGKAVEDASASGKRVYACADAGAYAESVSLDDAASGLEMFGGFSCDDWRYSETAKSRVTSPTPLALRVDDVTELHIEDFAFVAADATMPGESSIGGFVANSNGVVLRRVRVEAGNGMDGAAGVREDFSYPMRVALDGNAAMGGVGGSEKICTCPGGEQSSGGPGGTASLGGSGGGNGTPDWGAGKGGAAGTCNADSQRGGNAPGAMAANGASTSGALTESTWTPSAGDDGANGTPGQGGGGGSSSVLGGGGGGGCGACGGAGGTGGKGGGASIALVIFESELNVGACQLTVEDGGDGGNGVTGQLGQMESGFGGTQGAGACQGGAGGLGGQGGSGGGGAGGISVGILWSGDDAPSIDDETSLSFGAPGIGGLGGDPGMNDGASGVARELLEVP